MMLSRRSLIALATGCLGFPRLVDAAQFRLPALEALDAERLVQRSGLQRWATIERLGQSRGGRRIDLISVGSGSRSALVVGAPHPNEPIGCLTIERMLMRLGSNPRLREASGYRWHFIAAIDPDGLAMNEPWFAPPLTVNNYCRSFYRPPFRRQPEYSFPLRVDGYQFVEATPENLAWQRALSSTRPHLQCSLHGADSGGAFFICSRDLPELSRQLAQLPAQHSLTLNRVGEPFSDMVIYQPGVTSFFDVEAMLRTSAAQGKDLKQFWDAGDSSNGYALSRFQTFSMTCEVPLWRDARSADCRPSPWSIVDTLAEQIRVYGEDRELLEGALPALRPGAGSFGADALLVSLEEALNQAVTQPAELEELKRAQDPKTKLSYRDVVEYEPGTSAWRAPAMLARLAKLVKARSIESHALTLLRSRIAAQQRAGALTPVPLADSASLQMAAIDVAARTLS